MLTMLRKVKGTERRGREWKEEGKREGIGDGLEEGIIRYFCHEINFNFQDI